MSDYVPTARLRFVKKVVSDVDIDSGKAFVRRGQVLQQWWGPDVPGYMRDPSVGEWRDVVVVEDSL